jgi:hypothetical protein
VTLLTRIVLVFLLLQNNVYTAKVVAVQVTSGLVFGKEVRVVKREFDRYGRTGSEL